MPSAGAGKTFSHRPPFPVSFASLPTVILRKALGRALRQGHPWVYRDAVVAPPQVPAGAVVAVAEEANAAPLGWGYWDDESPIALRVLGVGPNLAEASDVPAAMALRLQDALSRRIERLDLNRTNAFRWVHGEADGLAGIHVDVYGNVATVRYDGVGAAAFYADALQLPRLLQTAGERLGLRQVVERRRRGVISASPQSQAPSPYVVLENGLRFLVDLEHGQKGGLFLDQRDNRARIASLAAGKRVLNLFGYTGAFSVYAAAAGALHTDTVDIAAPAMTAAQENFRLNGLPQRNAGFHAVDAFVFLENAIAAGLTWDIVISDPPSFAPNQKALATALAAYKRLHGLAAQVVAPGGLLAAASCSSHVNRAQFVNTVIEGARTAGLTFTQTAYAGAGFDHPVTPSFPEGDYLKFVLGHLSSS